jgi:hypothetical protein
VYRPAIITESVRIEGDIGAIAGGAFLFIGHLVHYLGSNPAGTTAGKLLVLAGHVVLVFAFIGLFPVPW